MKTHFDKPNPTIQGQGSKCQTAESSSPGIQSVLESATRLRELGLVPVLTRPQGKKPLGGNGWADQARLMTRKKFRYELEQNADAGLGVLLGLNGMPGWNNELIVVRPGVIDVEVDDPAKAAESLQRIWPQGPPKTLRFSSNRGRHYLFALDEATAETVRQMGITQAVIKNDPAYPGLELRFGTLDPAQRKGIQSVVPPILRADGTPRKWLGDKPVPLPQELLDDLAAHAILLGNMQRVWLPRPAVLKNLTRSTSRAKSFMGSPRWRRFNSPWSGRKSRLSPKVTGTRAVALATEAGVRISRSARMGLAARP